jgi:hypothetical protein
MTEAGIYETFYNFNTAIFPFLVGLTGFNSSIISSCAILTGKYLTPLKIIDFKYL